MMFAFLILTLIGTAAAAEWGYGDTKIWTKGFPDCDNDHQSPINIDTESAIYDARLVPFTFDKYMDVKPATLVNNGHTLQLNLNTTATLSKGDISGIYKPLQLHFHWSAAHTDQGSEHTVDGKAYPLEMHIVHMKTTYRSTSVALNNPNSFAVLGFFFQISDSDNPDLTTILNKALTVNETGSNIVGFSLGKLMDIGGSSLKDFYRYTGSLTTPPCSEVVVWTLFKTPLGISQKQLNIIWNIRGHDGHKISNFRHVQKLNERQVFTSSKCGMIKAFSFLILISFSVSSLV